MHQDADVDGGAVIRGRRGDAMEVMGGGAAIEVPPAGAAVVEEYSRPEVVQKKVPGGVKPHARRDWVLLLNADTGNRPIPLPHAPSLSPPRTASPRTPVAAEWILQHTLTCAISIEQPTHARIWFSRVPCLSATHAAYSTDPPRAANQRARSLTLFLAPSGRVLVTLPLRHALARSLDTLI